MRGFKALLKSIIFKIGWKIEEDFDYGGEFSAGITFEGAFASFKREFPERLIHTRIIFDDEPVRSIAGEYDVILEFRLHRYLDLEDATRQSRVLAPSLDTTLFTAYLNLNLIRHVPNAINRAAETVVS